MNATMETIEWGTITHSKIHLYRITNSLGTCLEISNYGAAIVALKFSNGLDAIIGEKDFDAFTNGTHPHFGLTTGRLAGRSLPTPFIWPRDDISRENQEEYTLFANEKGITHLHGGDFQIGRMVWNTAALETKEYTGITFHLHCPHNAGGYPGNIDIYTHIALYHNKNIIHTSYEVTSDRIAPVNLTNHAYFTLGDEHILSNILTLASDKVFKYNQHAQVQSLQDVAGTPFDFRNGALIGDVTKEIIKDDIASRRGLDHVFMTRNTHSNNPNFEDMTQVATLESPKGNTLKVYSTSSAIVCYAATSLDKYGKEEFPQYKSLCLETQNPPGFLHNPLIPASYATPSHAWKSFTEYEFTIK